MTRSDSVRVHAVILTQDRTAVLERCVNTAVRKLRRCDVLTVLDDSTPEVVAENAKLLATVASKSPAMITHLMPTRLYERIAEVTGGSALQWEARTAPRDIAPLRNLALLLSAAVRGRMTIFIDDDICGFDLELTHKHLEQVVSESEAVIIGAEISGQSEMDTLTRLHGALRRLKSGEIGHNTPLDELFCKTGGSSHHTGYVNCGWVSAGYMAFNIPPTRLFAFPPGYNEDWLWCLMHDISGEVRVVRSEQVVQHAPTELRRATHSNMLFELAGDLVFDSLRVYHDGAKRTPLATLCALARHTPGSEDLPTTRVAEVMKLTRRPLSKGRMWSCLNDYGLSAVEAVMHAGDLHVSERTILPDWCNDAIVKHKSYSSLPADEAVQAVMSAMTLEGRK